MVAKKWLFVGIFVLLSLNSAFAAPAAVHPVTGEPLVITCLRGTPTAIDGDLGDWNLDVMTPAVLDAEAQMYTGAASWTGPADCSGKFYLMWDDEKVYIAAIVKDDKLSMTKTGGDIWNADCVEFFFSTTNAVTGHAEHYQWGFNFNGQKWNWENMEGTAAGDPAYLQVASSKTVDGYICEASIEYAGIQSLDFVAGNTIGFHPVIDDTDDTDREIQMSWTGREAHDQSLGYGYLVFSSDPVVEPELAKAPSPAAGAVDVPVDAVLSWGAGKFAASHDVYLGTASDGVGEATRDNPMELLLSQGQAASSYVPDNLFEYGRTYYWRIDEVNAAPDDTIFKGLVWSFTAEPFSYPIENLTATASSQSRTDTGPEKTINGIGLNDQDQHSVDLTQMWMNNGSKPAWIQYEFDKPYKVDKLWVWNSNQNIESIIGVGAKDVAIEYSVDGTTWTTLEGVPQFAMAPGLDTYTADTVVDFGGVTAKYVKLTIASNWGGMTPVVSLSEVRFFYVPVQAFQPAPADGAVNVALDAGLTWRSGREATSHQVFFGVDSVAVAAGTVAGKTVTQHNYVPSALTFGTKYYWKVDELGDTGTYEGDLWSFTTREFDVIEDFESYNDSDDRIYNTWADGYSDKSSGSTVGYIDSANGTFCETSIVHGGRQSMPLAYDNSASPFYSETVREFDTPQNWSGSGASELCIWTRGYPALTSVAVTETGGKMTLAGAGADIWSTCDDFTYAYKTLTGDGTIIARVTGIGAGTNTWAKGGVMIRDSLNGGSAHAMMVMTANTDGAAGNGASFQYRATTDGDSANTDSAVAVKPPYWVKIERMGDSLIGSISADNKTWTIMGTTPIVMENPVQIGLCVTSHVAGESRTFQFESISTTGNVTGSWQSAAIDAPQYNSAADMYVTVADSTGKSATATSATAATVADWTAWKIPMNSLSGVSFSKVKKLTIGVGTKGATTAGGTGMVFIDDIGYGHSAQ